MTFNIILVIISLIFENIINMIFSNNSYILSLFTILSLIFIYPYYKNSKKDYLLFSMIAGFIYDVINTNFYILNPLIFVLISYFIYMFFRKFKYKLLNVILVSIFVILFYQFLLFVFFNVTSSSKYSINDFIFIINHYYIINILYSICLYFISTKHDRIG